MKKLQGAALMAITVLALGAPARQAAAAPVAGPDAETVERAHELVIQARQLSENFQEYHAASKLYRKAAQLYGNEVEAAEAWAMAGTLAFYSGDNRASSDLTRAGEIALTYGRVHFAAKSFLDAAWVAHDRGMNRTALALATRGYRLAGSPLLAEADRRALQSRVVGTELGEAADAAEQVVKR